MKKTMTNTLGTLLAGRGFYIVLLLCVAALGVSGYYLFAGVRDLGREVVGQAAVTVTPTPKPRPSPVPTRPPADVAQPTAEQKPAVAAVPLPSPTPTPPPIPEVTLPAVKPAEPQDTVTATASVFTWPVKGKVLRSWAVETLAFDRTMGDWRVHDGVDIAAEAGTPVMAPAGGTVCDLYEDDLLGTCVVILHADGVLSTCGNLEKAPTVEIGDLVRTGDVIGSVGTSALGESGEESHLHLSMTRDGISVDPLEYLPEK